MHREADDRRQTRDGRRRLLTLVTPVLAMSTAACLVAPHEPYYRPSYPGPAGAVRTTCGGAEGPRAILAVPAAQGVTLKMRLHRNGDGVARSLWVGGPQNPTVRIVSGAFVLGDVASRKRRTIGAKSWMHPRASDREIRTLTFEATPGVPARAA